MESTDSPIDPQSTEDAGATPLMFNHELYFILDESTLILPLTHLRPTRLRPQGVRNAIQYMEAAAEGKHPKRAPLSVRPDGDYFWTIVDGNSTYEVARQSEWPSIPCKLEENI